MFQDIPLDSSEDDADCDWDIIDPQYDVPQPPEEAHQSSYNAPATSTPESDEDDDAQEQLAPRRKPGGYDSRIEQILYENPELPILITDAGKSLESGGRYIVYTIRTGVSIYKAFRCSQWLTEPLGSRGSQTVLRVLFASRGPHSTSPHHHYPSDSGETYYGRLRGQPDEREAGPADYRPAEAHAGSVPKSLSEKPTDSDGRGVVAIPRPQCELGMDSSVWSRACEV